MMKKKILFVNDEMTIGGVSRILNTLLIHLNPEKYDIQTTLDTTGQNMTWKKLTLKDKQSTFL